MSVGSPPDTPVIARKVVITMVVVSTAPAGRPLRDALSQLRLHELTGEVQDRTEQIVETRDRTDGLVEAMLTVTSGLELDQTFRAIVHTAIDLVDAATAHWEHVNQTISSANSSSRESATTLSRRLAHCDEGSVSSVCWSNNPQPIRLDTLANHPASEGFPPNHPPMTMFLGVPDQSSRRGDKMGTFDPGPSEAGG